MSIINSDKKYRIIGFGVLLAIAVIIALGLIYRAHRVIHQYDPHKKPSPHPEGHIIALNLPVEIPTGSQSTTLHAETTGKTQTHQDPPSEDPIQKNTLEQLSSAAANELKQQSDVKNNPHRVHHTSTHKKADKKPLTASLPATAHTSNKQFTTPYWVLQVASFNNDQRAKHLVKKLNLLGLHAFTHQANIGQRIVYRVHVGPEHDKLILQRISQNIQQQLHLVSVLKKW